MAFNKYTYLWPPRPSEAISTTMLNFYEKRNWIGQYKKNGTCTVLYVTPEKEIIAKTRHNDDHKLWKPTDQSTGIFKSLPGDGWYVFVVEVLHSKVRNIKDTVYIFDILVNNGVDLVGTTFAERQDMLTKMFNVQEEADTDDNIVQLFAPQSHYVLTPNTWLAKSFKSDFKKMMRIISNDAPEEGAPENEGIVLKNPTAQLEPESRATSNSGWQVKCRIPHKNYSF